MTEPNQGPLLFVVTGNHGSLVDTMLFLHGTNLRQRSVLLVPQKLRAIHQGYLAARVREYSSFNDLVHWIQVERPSMVFLFCGYLLTTTGKISAADLKRLVRLLEERGCPTVTNDPCWGLASTGLKMRSRLPGRTIGQKVQRALVEWLLPRRLRQAYRALKGQVHCYPAPIGPTLQAHGVRAVSYFNPAIASFSEGMDAWAPEGEEHPWRRPMEKPYWAFILARLDYGIQVNLHGQPAFIDSLVARLRDAHAANRHAVLIAPEDCLAAVRAHSPGLPDVSLIDFCDYQQYVSLLMFAEYAFYWNAASSSSLYRLANGLPVFFFDRGHVSRWFKGFFDRTVELLYCGHAPAILDHRDPLTPVQLQGLAQAYRESAQDIVRQLKQLPAPDQMIEQVRANHAEPARRSDRW